MKEYKIKDVLIKGKINSGTFGEIYNATLLTNPSLNIVLKKYKCSSLTIDIIREIIFLQYLDKYTIKIYGTIYFNDTIYIILEKFGHSLNYFIRNNIKLSQNEYKILIYNILFECYRLHSNGILHSDIKPENILVNSNLDVKFIDFGLSLYLGIDPKYTKKHLCTEHFKPPNDKRFSYQSDSFSIGQTIYTLLRRKYIYLNDIDSNAIYLNKKISFLPYSGVDFFKDLLAKNILERLPVKDILNKYFNIKMYMSFNKYELSYLYELTTLNKQSITIRETNEEKLKYIKDIYEKHIKHKHIPENCVLNSLVALRNMDIDFNIYILYIYISLETNIYMKPELSTNEILKYNNMFITNPKFKFYNFSSIIYSKTTDVYINNLLENDKIFSINI